MKQHVMAVLFAFIFLCAVPAHAVEKECFYCHAGHDGTSVLLRKEIRELCLDCHQDRAERGEHKVGMVPSMPVGDMPLHEGKITCVTCHNPHSKSPLMLRRPADEICLSCHKI